MYFSIFTYKVAGIESSGGLFQKSEDSETIKKYLEKLEFCFGGAGSEMRMQKINKYNADNFPCTVMAHDRHIAWLRLEKEKDVSVYQKEESHDGEIAGIELNKIPSTPYSFVIFSFTPENMVVAIQSLSDAWRNPESIRSIVESSINRIIQANKFDFDLKIEAKLSKPKFWDYNMHRLKVERVAIKKITISLSGKHTIKPEVIDLIRSNGMLSELQNHMYGGTKADFVVYDPKTEMFLAEKQHAENMLCILASHSSEDMAIKMKYTDGVSYTCGKEMRMEIDMPDHIMIRFGFDNIGNYDQKCEIELWMEQAKKEIEKLDYVVATERKPRRQA